VSRDTTLDTVRALQQLGITGSNPRSFGLSDSPAVPVVQVADISSSTGGEIIEPRAAGGATVTVPASGINVPMFELVAASEGGLVVEDLTLNAWVLSGTPATAVAIEGAWLAAISGARFSGLKGVRIAITANQAASRMMDVGQIQSRSFANTGERPLLIATQSIWLPPDFSLSPNVRWYVPPGGQLTFQMNARRAGGVSPLGNVQFTFREMIGRASAEAGTGT